MDNFPLGAKLAAHSFTHHDIHNGEVWINKRFIEKERATAIFNRLVKECHWEQPVIRMGAKIVNSPRLAAWYGDPGAVYLYSGLVNHPHFWTEPLLELRTLLEKSTGFGFNSVLVNLYRDGCDSMGWHRDNEPELGEQPTIASISLGASRRFVMRHVKRDDLRMEWDLGHGAGLIMTGDTQRWWKHSVPKTKLKKEPRINLTFRRILDNS